MQVDASMRWKDEAVEGPVIITVVRYRRAAGDVWRVIHAPLHERFVEVEDLLGIVVCVGFRERHGQSPPGLGTLGPRLDLPCFNTGTSEHERGGQVVPDRCTGEVSHLYCVPRRSHGIEWQRERKIGRAH